MDESDEDPRLPHHRIPEEFVPSDHLAGQNSNSHSMILFFCVFFFFCSVFNLSLTRVGDHADLGVLYWQLNPKDYEKDVKLQRIRETRGYNYMVLHSSCYFLLLFLNVIFLVLYDSGQLIAYPSICFSQFLDTEDLQLQI